jgi:DNA segregation ATPase FtsK/SpoIIIE-like protein
MSDVPENVIEEAILLINNTMRCSTTMFIRRMKLTFSQACRLMDVLEERGVCGPPMKDGGAREILMPGIGGIPRF